MATGTNGEIQDGGSMASLPQGFIPAPVAVTKSEVDPILTAVIQDLQAQAEEEATERLKGNQAKSMMPPLNEWDGDIFDLIGMAKPFDSAKSNEWFAEATKKAASPGTTGDLIITTAQVDMLGCMERAFRARHTSSRPRMLCHAMARKQGHGSATGPLRTGILGRLSDIVKEAKTEPGKEGTA